MGRPAIDLDGQKFGRLLATNELRVTKYGKGRERKCVCDCGAVVWIQTNKLTSGHTSSCGCWLTSFKKLPPGQAVRNQILDDYKRGAKNRNLTWDLSEKEFDCLIFDQCFYCNSPPLTIRKARRMNGDLVYNGIDRKDNSLGYISSNVVTCCKVCNRAKSDMSFEGFLEWIDNVRTAWCR